MSTKKKQPGRKTERSEAIAWDRVNVVLGKIEKLARKMDKRLAQLRTALGL